MSSSADSLKTNKKPAIIALSGVILWQAVIFGHSLTDSVASSEESGFLTKLLNDILPFELTEHFVRKAGHFTEFFILGVLLVLLFRAHRPIRKDISRLGWFILPGPVTAMIDEFLQTFSEGRSPEVRDCLLDTAGFLTGFILIYIVLRVTRKDN